ncbi:PREDICTED: WUSCHEL-related homeobox 9-like isoform X1 [Brassica oleracea var. oleracea]|uniref:WUSCHEL-related homeobox 9-like isoform X1 n=1 Tax=Brassica oleracea var. oleracea TaxID=109376 RepID=UPI0006A6AAA2|nr:PREDICTED: WUSCHEL-related homeobox 9-like isoform X1 [Brassica oleracea var. oleracea]
MASSNRHWPSMFKSKPHHHQWQHDINSPPLPSSASHRSSPFSGCEVERSPEPKPRWNPKPEQIRVLEAIFNSGMVNPPREEIRRIRAQLQEYGQVGDANVFYWFQNRKSRSKHKIRLLHKHSLSQPQPQPQQPSSPSSSSSKSTKPHKNKDKNNNTNLSLGGGQMMGMFPSEDAFLFPVSTVGAFGGITASSQLGFLSGDMIEQHKPAHPTVEPCTGYLLSEIMNGNASYGTHHQQHLSDKEDEEMSMKMLQQPQHYAATSHQITSYNNNIILHVPPTTSTTTTITTSDPLDIVLSTSDQLQVQVCARIRVFINEMEFEVSPEPFNVRDAFGEEVVLINSAGQPIVTDEYGVALQPLQHGASYYLVLFPLLVSLIRMSNCCEQTLINSKKTKESKKRTEANTRLGLLIIM